MWSVKQYKELGKEVERNWKRDEKQRQLKTNRSPVQDEPSSDRESNSAAGTLGGLRGSGTSNEDLEKVHTPSEHDDNGRIIVECTSDDDPINPRNWPLATRAKAVAILCMLVFVQAYAAASDSLANSKASRQYHVSPVADNLTTAMCLFGIGFGCLLVGPLSESFGRNPVYLTFSFAYLFFVLGTALSTTFGSQIVCRFFVGLSSSATLGINGASVGDMFSPVERTLWFPVIAWVNVVPPVIAPIVGGWVASRDDLGWQWMDWISLIISAFAFIIAFSFLPETYMPMILEWKAAHLRTVTGDDRYVAKHEVESSLSGRLLTVLKLSVRFITTEPAILALGGFLVLLYILLFTFLSGFDYVFKKTYNLTSLQQGACFASIAIGATSFTLTAPLFYAWSRRRTGYVEGASVEPEFRLWPALVLTPLLPISLFWLGWTNYASISIWSGLGACFCFGLVLNALYVSSYEYIIDSYSDNAAIALASITMMRYLIAGGMVMAARPMYMNIGVHWTMTLLGCVAAILTPGPYLLYKFGAILRKKSPYATTDVQNSDTQG